MKLKKNGKYIINTNLIFEGEYLNRIGKEYYDNGNLLYEGQYLMERKKE